MPRIIVKIDKLLQNHFTFATMAFHTVLLDLALECLNQTKNHFSACPYLRTAGNSYAYLEFQRMSLLERSPLLQSEKVH
jgi:hypothetical protein